MTFEAWSQDDLADWQKAEKAKGAKRKRRGSPERNSQVALFLWAQSADALESWPELAWLHAIPNGGHRIKAVATQMKREGVRRGVPDVCLPVPAGSYHGLYLEMKAGQNKPTKDQKDWLRGLANNGYCVAVCYSTEDAKQVIIDYLRLRDLSGRQVAP